MTIRTVRKRSRKTETFDKSKIERSVMMAGRDTGEFGRREAEKIVRQVLAKLPQVFGRRRVVSVGEIREIVEPAIAEAGYFATAKYYILYRKERRWEDGVKEPKGMSRAALQVARRRYLRTDMKGKVVETVGECFKRVARHIAKAEINWGSEARVEEMARAFYERMVNFKFVCAGKAMFEAGNPGGTGQLSSCFVLPVEDSIGSIFKTLGEAAVIHKNNGGTGFNFSQIRPHGDKVRNVPKAASGPVDFMRAYSAALSQILQGAKRQGANMAILDANHPDIEEFIMLKDRDGTIKNFNVSVGVVDKFMEAVTENRNWELVNPRNEKVWKKVKARKLFELIVRQAWKTGDPGLAFLDRMEADNPTPSLGKIVATNPCGEIALLPYESCNLTSVVLSNHVKKNKRGKWEIDWEDLERSVKLGVRFLDDMIEVNSYPIEEIRQMVKEGNRRIGLGVMGFAHLLYKLKIAYNSQEAVRVSERIAKFMRKKAEEASLELGRKRGPFPNFDISIYARSAERYRNCALLMIAPTGTTSLLTDTSSGIEPVFALVTLRRAFNEEDRRNKPTKEMVIVDPVLKEALVEVDLKKLKNKNTKRGFGSVESLLKLIGRSGLGGVEGLPKWFKSVFVTTHDIAAEWHVKIQAAWQKWIDNSVSKTINFAKSATVEEVKKAYLLAWKLGCKGITIYRDGCKADQVLSRVTGDPSTAPPLAGRASTLAGRQGDPSTSRSTLREEPFNKLRVGKPSGSDSKSSGQAHSASRSTGQAKPAVESVAGLSDVCPECGSKLVFAEGCESCIECGWSKCSL